MNLASCTLGLYGKMPAVGDFVHRGFSPELLGSLDRFFRTTLNYARDEGTVESLKASEQSFTLHIRPAALCSSGFLGCVVPSVDRVGRVFPLCVGLEVPSAPQSLRAPLPWISLRLAIEVCGATYAAQEQEVGPDELMNRLPPADAWSELMAHSMPFASAGESTVPLVSPSTTQFAFEGPEARMDPLDKAVCSSLPMQAAALGAVITDTPVTQFGMFFATRSLLSWAAMAALFDGRWEHWGWTYQRRASTGDEDDEDTVIPPLDEDPQ